MSVDLSMLVHSAHLGLLGFTQYLYALVGHLQPVLIPVLWLAVCVQAFFALKQGSFVLTRRRGAMALGIAWLRWTSMGQRFSAAFFTVQLLSFIAARDGLHDDRLMLVAGLSLALAALNQLALQPLTIRTGQERRIFTRA